LARLVLFDMVAHATGRTVSRHSRLQRHRQRLVEFDEDALPGAHLGSLHDGVFEPQRHIGETARTTGIVQHLTGLGHVRDAVFELDEDIGAVIDTETVPGAQVLIDPNTHRDGTLATMTEHDSTEHTTVPTFTSHDAPPAAKQVPHVWDRPTGPVDDPFAWLADRDDPDTVAYLEAENAYTVAWFARHDGLVEEVFGEIRSRVQEDDLSAPVRRGDWWYVSRTIEGKSYPVHCRGGSAERAEDVVLLDENLLADGLDYFALDAFDVSRDDRFLAWSSDTDGSERYTMRIRDLVEHVDLADTIEGTTWGGTAWSADARHLFYVRPDDAMRPYQVWRHVVGTPAADDVCVFEESDERFFVGVELSRSGEWIFITAASHTSSEVRLVPADDPTAEPRVVRSRVEDVEYHLDHWGDRFVVLTNLDAVDFRIMTAPIDAPGEWVEFQAHVTGRRITSVQPFAGHLAVHEWRDAQPQVRIIRRDGSSTTIAFDGGPHDVELDANPEWRSDLLRVRHQSLIAPPTVWDIDVTTDAAQTATSDGRTLVKQLPTPNVDLGRYRSWRTWATADDGTQVAVDVITLADRPAGPGPCLIYGYGSYEASMPPWFSVARLSLVDRGWAWALVHPRGGGEGGRRWYLDGKLLSKRNTFTDTLACAEHLVTEGVTENGHMVVRGGSAGGLLVGACITMRPDLWGGAVAEVPFVDVVTTMSDPSLPLTVTEWEEWGDPRSEPFASYIASYSPYDNTVTGVDYPPVFVTAGLNDPRVSYHEPAKWVARLRHVQADDALVLLRTELGAGHGGASGRYDRWRDEARIITFCLVCASSQNRTRL
jgi:oligopeptidase B